MSSLSICRLFAGFTPTVAQLPLIIMIAGCAQLKPTFSSFPDASNDPTIQAADFPTLTPIPEQPPPGTSFAQGQALEKELETERVNTRYTGDAVRYETGHLNAPPSLPPPRAPASPIARPSANASALPDTSVIGDDIAEEGRGYAADNDITDDDRSLGNFLDALEVGRADELELMPDNVPLIEPFDEEVKAPTGDLAPAETNPVVEIDETVIDFAEAGTVVPNDAVLPLQSAARDLIDANLGARIVAEGADEEMALERARVVAALLVARGVPGTALAVETAGPGNRVVVYGQPFDG